MTTPILGMTEWVENQNQPHVPVNGMIRQLEAFASLVIVQAFKNEPDDSNDEEDGDVFLVATGSGTWASHDDEIALYSNGLVFIPPRAGLLAWVIADQQLLQYTESDGWELASFAGGATAQPYVAGSMYNGAPTTDLVVMRHPFPIEVIFPSGLTDSQGYAGVAATGTTDFDIQKNGVSIGTMSFAAAATVATFTMASDETFDPGDVLEVIAPTVPDATLADIGFSFLGER